VIGPRLRGCSRALGAFPDEAFPDGKFLLVVVRTGEGWCAVALDPRHYDVVKERLAPELVEHAGAGGATPG
jgi:hypothetical protein